MPNKKKITRRDDQSVISSNKEHVKYEATQTYLFVSFIPAHDRLHLTGKQPQKRSQGPQQQQSKPSYCLLTTAFEWRSLTTGGTCIIQPSRPRERSHSQCCWLAFPGAVIVSTTTSSSFKQACDCHVFIHVCMYVYLPKFNTRSTAMTPTAVPWDFLPVILFISAQNMTQMWK